jgi:hypothetical protein
MQLGAGAAATTVLPWVLLELVGEVLVASSKTISSPHQVALAAEMGVEGTDMAKEKTEAPGL